MPKKGTQARAAASTSPLPHESGDRPSVDEAPSPPRTPPPQVARAPKGKGGVVAARSTKPRPSVRDAFAADKTRDGENEAAAGRDSHDLHWVPHRQRRSVLENMLASLDQAASIDSLGQVPAASGAAESHRYTIAAPSRDNSQSDPATSPEYYTAAESPSKIHHRSNSSHNYQSQSGRFDEIVYGAQAKEEDVRADDDPLNATPKAAQKNHNGSGRANRGNSSGSVDLPHPADSYWQHNLKRRSRSFDQGYKRPELFSQSQFPYNTAADQATASAIFHSFEAAPMPTVHAGPRRQEQPGSLPTSPVQPTADIEPVQNPSSPRGSVRSPMGYISAPERSSSPRRGDPSTDRPERPSNLRHGTSYDESMRPSQSIDMPSYSTVTSVSGPTNTPSRPGFFRRVFAAGKSSFALEPPQAAYTRHASDSAASSSARHDNSVMAGSVSDSQQTPPLIAKDAKKTKGGEKDKDRPSLNKKSSFFRRRKKSVSAGVADLPPQLHPELPTRHPVGDEADRATPSSLRQAIDTYMPPPGFDLDGYRSSVDASRERPYEGQGTIRAVTQSEQRAPVIWDSTQYHEGSRNNSVSADTPNRPSKLENNRNEVDAGRKSTSRDGPSQASRAHRKQNNEQTNDPESRSRENSTQQSILQSIAKATEGADYTSPTSSKSSRHSASLKSPKSPKSPQFDMKKQGVDNSITTTMTTTTTTMTTIRRSEDRKGTVTSPKHKPSTEKPPEQVWVIPDATLVPPSKPPPPPPVSPTVTTPAVTPLGDQAQSVPVSEASEDENGEPKAPSPSEIARFVAQQGLEPHTIAHEEDAPASDAQEPSEEDRDQAQKLFNGVEGIDRGDAAAWLGEEGSDRARVRKAYMQLFDWSNMSVLQALRSFCAQTRLKGETQQVDRVLDGLSARWCECNPNHGFKATDVVHTICYSLLLLNTDLHTANIESKMSRNQFIRNTLPTIERVVEDAAPEAFRDTKSAMPPPSRTRTEPSDSPSLNATKGGDLRRPGLSRHATDRSDSDAVASNTGTSVDGSEPAEDCGPLVNVPFTGKQAAWELQIEVVLKNFYNSIRQERLYLYGTDQMRPSARGQPSSASLSAMGGMRRSNSIASRTGSESFIARGRGNEGRPGFGSRFSSKTRSRPKLYPSSSSFARSRTSVDEDGTSAISPSASSLWSRMSFGKTANSMSVSSFPPLPQADYQQSVGFANALSQAMIREETVGDGDESLRVRPLLEDESLELTGAPWAKEGIVQHKHHLEAVDKKARDRSWVECFAVIEKGWMRLFQFNVTARSLRQKSRSKSIGGGVVGGGNWSENAEPMGAYLLRQSIATALPPPGYSKSRQHVWALSLPTGAVYLFHVGTPEIVKEFVSTANYWSARMSKEPLVGGVSNIEYGWSEAVVNMALVQDRESRPSTTGSVSGSRPSIPGSIRNSIDRSAVVPRLPADRVNVTDWKPPMQSTMPSQLMEVDQLRALEAYVSNIEKELKRHNELRVPMQLAFSPRHPNYLKAMNNWERKSSYLLQEIVKFSTYIESLRAAQTHKEKIYAERKEREAEMSRATGLQELPAQGDAGTGSIAPA